MLTVIMPARDAAQTIRSAVRSTLAAMPRDSELVVYDDSSSDGTVSSLSELLEVETRLRLIVGTSHQGAAGARNALIKSTDSDLIAAMDADDVCLPNRFWSLRERLVGKDAVFDPIVRFGLSGFRFPRPRPISADAMPLALLVLNPLPQSTMIAHRSSLEDVGPYEGGFGQDYQLWLRMAAGGQRLQLRSFPSVAYREHAGQATRRADYRRLVSHSPSIRTAYETLAEREGIRRVFSLPREEVLSRLRVRTTALRSRDRRTVTRLLGSTWSLPLLS